MFEKLIRSFQLKNISVISVNNGEDACKKILEMIPENSSIGYGGSMTLESIGILDRLREKEYNLLDRTKYPKGSKELHELQLSAQHANFFLSSCNAITEDGKIVVRETNGNRCSSLIYGPDKVIIVVGRNKIVEDIDKAMDRLKITAPKIAMKLNKNTPCVKTGKCEDCSSPDRICCYTITIEKQIKPDRMTVILVNEELGI